MDSEGPQLPGLEDPPPRWRHHLHDKRLDGNGGKMSSAVTTHRKSHLQHASLRKVCLLTWHLRVPKVSVLENKTGWFGLL